MRKVFLMLMMTAVGFGLRGQTKTEVNGIFYELNASASTASVISGYQAGITEVPYDGVITVPSTFVYDGTTYTVTSVADRAFQYATCTEVTLPASCTTSGRYTFDSMSSLVKLDLGGINNLLGNSITGCPVLNDLYLGYTGGVVGTVGASIASSLKENLNVHVPDALKAAYTADSFWNSVKAILVTNQEQIGDLYYEYYPGARTAMVLAPYEIPGNGKPTQIGPAVEVPGAITVDGTEYTVTNLQAGVFYDTPNVTSVKFNEGLKNIEFETFYGTKVSEVTFPNTLENLSYNNFYACTSLSKVTFGTGIKTIGDNTFYYCPGMTELVVLAEVPPTLEAGRSGNMFSATFNKANVTLTVPAGKIDAYKASPNWSGFKEYKEAGGTQPVDKYVAVDGIYYELNPETATAAVTSGYKAGITEVPYSGVITIPSTISVNGNDYTVTSVAMTAFQYATCTEVVLPSTCTTLGRYAFDNMASLVKLNLGGVSDLPGNTITSCPALVDLYLGYTGGVVGTVGASLASSLKENLNVHVPDALKAAYTADSFWNSVKAILVTNQEQIGDLYYEYYPGARTAMVLAPYEIPGNGKPTQIGPAVEVPGAITVDGTEYTVTNLQAGVFYDTPNVTSVKFNEGLKNIEFETFYGTKVSEVTFPNTLENLSYNNFYACTSLSKVTFGTGIKTIGDNTFYYCPGMTELVVLAEVPPTLEAGRSGSIFNANFNKANVTLTVPAGKVAAYKASPNWSGFKEYREYGVEPDPTHVVVDGIYYELTDKPYDGEEEDVLQCYVESPVRSGLPAGDEYNGVITIPETITYNTRKYVVTQIKNQSFYMQSEVTEVKIPATVEVICMQAFQESGITTVTLPAILTRIDNNAFRRCSSLKTMIAQGLTPAVVGSGAFTTITSTCTLYVPHGMVNTYKAADGWKDFLNIEEDPNSPILPASVSIEGKPRAMLVGDKVQLQAAILPMDTSDKSVEWKSLNPEVAQVDDTGQVTALAPGNAQIEVICNGNRAISMIATWICIAKEAVVDGINYRFEYVEKDKIADAYVIKPASGTYTGDINLPDQVLNMIKFNMRGISDGAFENCTGVTSVSLPAGTTTLGAASFRGCTALHTVTVNAKTPPTFPGYTGAEEQEPFSASTYETCKLYVPAGSYAAYRDASVWKKFKNIRAIGGDEYTEANIDGILYALYDFYGTATVLPSADYTGEITVPESVTFSSKVYNVTEIQKGAFAGTSIDILRLPANLKAIPDEMAANCPSLISVGLPDHLETIGVKAFYGSTNIRFIRSYNFGKDNSLVPPSFTATEESDYGNAFSPEIWPDCMLVVPASMFANYKETVGWKNFRSFAYWHVYDVAPTAVEYPGTHKYLPESSVTLTPATTPDNATILNFVIKTDNPSVASYSAGKDADGKTALIVNTLAEGEAEVTVYMNLVKTSFKLTVSKEAGIGSVTSDDNLDVRYFNLQGIEIKNPEPGTVCVKVTGAKVEKIVYTAE